MKSKFVIFVVMGTLLVVAIYSSSMFVVFALPRDGYVETCTNALYKNGNVKSQTCCIQRYTDWEASGKLHCTKTCYAQNGNEITCPKRTAEEDMVDPGLLGDGTLKDGGTNDTGNNTEGKLNFGP